MIANHAALSALRLGKMAHGGEEHHEALPVLRDVGGLFHRLGQQDHVSRRIKTVEHRGFRVQLVSQHQDQIADRPLGCVLCHDEREIGAKALVFN